MNIADMVERPPWLEENWDFPAEVIQSTRGQADTAAAT